MPKQLTYVRGEMLAPKEPPLREAGVVKWLRENLFSGPLNTILTLLGLLATAWLLLHLVPWLMHSVWNAGSLGECRQIIAATWGEGATGACWAVVRERWPQYIFGFYPQDFALIARLSFADQYAAAGGYEGVFGAAVNGAVREAFIADLRANAGLFDLYVLGYWRPILAFVLMFVAIAPVLFTALPRKMIWFSLLYPALAFWLLWGGTVWLPVVALLGFAVMGAVFTLLKDQLGVPVSAGLGLVAAVLWWLFAQAPVTAGLQSALPFGLASVDSDQFGGFLLSIVIGVTAISASLPMGILLALGRRSDMLLVRTLSVGFIEFIRGVPLITLLFTASLLLQYFLPPGNNFDIILRVIILVTFFAAAYIAEVIRGGLAALPRGQYEAADALGLDYWQAQRLVVMPQALKISIPGIVSSFIGLFKDTTLVAFVGLMDPLKGITAVVRADIDWKGIYWEPYIFAGTLFFIICFGMSRYSMWLERKLKTDHR
ncbi:L-glutamine ABC transporter membrane protein/L-glutamate ABC transporter membrane protein/L-aspartate ABC transporter membrane protein/L-asparagine ABC transporter membrane protein [Gemmobacter aquatilis]|uniref:L-glutamine ABC transporter membrane protein/L-glutamate ABC transporter membrane protein/L-aspartate ABC transporter membrane protein/L-asparagine ABC transporter membrane protein n=1 Tax=Gemmobacter aquatilis TaxID=933059 RepID=A0A1H8KBQ4_9RHOB|nr:amino acid ABC transporter permease [Gemmobacter aquatilis]SEN90410.1 L-glutamine ABC transporter membrane protein/L-glutamate ABC transporter membrane protein/L-aspartate ABC transporter membrane protein/L-asparagine ABC transporter membrane protein [Gemmobacter aquatilis]